MKHNRRFLGIAFAILSMVITSCTGLLPNQSRRSNSSIENIESSSFEETSSNDKTSSNSKSSSNKSSNYSSSDHTTHTFGEWVVIIPPTCTSDGVQRRECSVCHLIEEKTLPANGHTWGEWRTVVSATCLEEGSESRVCVVCNEQETRAILATGHKWSEWQDDIAPTCTEQGRRKRVCNNCGSEEYQTLQALGHRWEYVETINEPTCTNGGSEKERCSYCGEEQIRELDPRGHSFVFVDNEKDPMPSKTSEGVIKCENCGLIQLFIKASEVTDESKKHLVFDEDGGARFWGRPIANDVALNEDGDADPDNHEAIYNPNQTGDYFEFIFNLSAKEVNSLNTCRLYCDAKPDRWIKVNGLDFYARKEGDTEWTAGFYPSGEREGQEITDYRYVLFVDDQLVTFDSSIKNPVTSDGRGEFVVPYTFHMHEGINKIRLHMSGGYRSTFYNFIFRPYDEPVHVHTWGENVVTEEPTCTEGGEGYRECTRCGEKEKIDLEPLGHDLTIIDNDIEPSAGKCKATVNVCSKCGETFMNFNVNDVTDESKSRLVFEENENGEVGARFWGRSIGNAQEFDSGGVAINYTIDECVYSSTERGDFFEYVFDLTAEQAEILKTCRLYCDAKPADYLYITGDFWAYGKSNDDWTPGYYIDGADEHVQKNEDGTVMMVNDHAQAVKQEDGSYAEGVELETRVKMGKRIENYRYILYVDGQPVEFDQNIRVPIESRADMKRDEYVLPYTFNLHEGENRFSLHMAGGYRSTFYNFKFVSVDAHVTFQYDIDGKAIVHGVKDATLGSAFGLENLPESPDFTNTQYDKEYIFVGWYLDPSFLTPFSPNRIIDKTETKVYGRILKRNTFEAEYADLTDLHGVGASVELYEEAMIFGYERIGAGKNTGADWVSNGWYIAGLYFQGASVTYQINASQDINDALLMLRVSSEFKALHYNPLTPETFAIVVNGEDFNYELPLTLPNPNTERDNDPDGEKTPFADVIVSYHLNLKKGLNTIKFETRNSWDYGSGTLKANAPMIDCFYIYTEQTNSLTMNENHEFINRKGN